MGKYKKCFYYFFVIFISLFFIKNVNAETLSYNFPDVHFVIEVNSNYTAYYNIDINNAFAKYGKGILTFSYLSRTNSTDGIYQILVYLTNGKSYVCDIGNNFSSNLETSYYTINTANCSLDLSEYGIDKIAFVADPYPEFVYVHLSDVMSFTNDSSYEIIQAIQKNNYNTLLNNMYSSLETFRKRTNEQLTDLYYLIEDGNLSLEDFRERTNEQLADLYFLIEAGNSNISSTIDKTAKETQNKLNNIDTSINQVDDTLNNSDSSNATNSAGSFFSGFTTDTFGLTSIITAPLNLITSITSSTCSPVGLPIPFMEGQTLNLPCLRGIYEQHFGNLLDIYQIITFGIVAYWVCVRIFALVKDFKNPEHDEIEVMDL